MISGVIFLQWAGEREKGDREREERHQTSNLGCRSGVGRGKNVVVFVGISHTRSSWNAGVVFNRSVIILREPGRDETLKRERGRDIAEP